MNTNYSNPELERYLVPEPMRHRFEVVRSAVAEAILADQAAFPDTMKAPERQTWPSTQNVIPLNSEAAVAHVDQPVAQEVSQVVQAVTNEISDAQRAVAEAFGAQDDFQKAA